MVFFTFFSASEPKKIKFTEQFYAPTLEFICFQAALAQSVERKALNLVVAGSSPAGGVRLSIQ